MKAGIIIIIILLSAYFINAQQNLEIVYDLEYSLWAGHYPDQINKETTYNDRMDLKTGIITKFAEIDSLWFTVGFYQDEYDHRLRLERTGFLNNYKLLTYGYLYERAAGLGNYSRIYSCMQNIQKYDAPFLIKYCFNGVDLSFQNLNYSVSARLGGNEFNDFIADVSFKFSKERFFQQFSFAYTGRDNYFQDQMLSLNYEGWWDNDLIWLYGVWSGQLLEGKHSSTENVMHNLGFMESVLTLSNFFKIGGNYRSRFLDDDEKERDSSAYCRINYRSHDLNLIYTDSKYLMKDIMESFSIAYWVNITQTLCAGIFASKYLPDTGNKYYETGLHVRMRK